MINRTNACFFFIDSELKKSQQPFKRHWFLFIVYVHFQIIVNNWCLLTETISQTQNL